MQPRNFVGDPVETPRKNAFRLRQILQFRKFRSGRSTSRDLIYEGQESNCFEIERDKSNNRSGRMSRERAEVIGVLIGEDPARKWDASSDIDNPIGHRETGSSLRRRFYAFFAYSSNGCAENARVRLRRLRFLLRCSISRVVDRKIERLRFRESRSFPKHGVATRESAFTSRSPMTLDA